MEGVSCLTGQDGIKMYAYKLTGRIRTPMHRLTDDCLDNCLDDCLGDCFDGCLDNCLDDCLWERSIYV